LTCLVVVLAGGSTRFPAGIASGAQSSNAHRSNSVDEYGNQAVSISEPPLRFAVPHNWLTLNVLGQTLERVRRELRPSNPALASYLSKQAQALLEQHASFWAVDPTTGANVSVAAFPGRLEEEVGAASLRVQLRAVPQLRDVVVTPTVINGRNALRAESTLRIKQEVGAPQDVHVLQAYIVEGSETVIVTATSPYLTTGAAILGSIRIP
jgi:hypothetical protein